MSHAAQLAINWIEQGLVPDAVVRAGIRRLCEQRLREISSHDCEAAAAAAEQFVRGMDASDIALLPQRANEQHYEVPTRFYQLCLGPRLKYSGCLYPTGTETLAQAEEAMLALYAEPPVPLRVRASVGSESVGRARETMGYSELTIPEGAASIELSIELGDHAHVWSLALDQSGER